VDGERGSLGDAGARPEPDGERRSELRLLLSLSMSSHMGPRAPCDAFVLINESHVGGVGVAVRLPRQAAAAANSHA
jgi:hypothetical protein